MTAGHRNCARKLRTSSIAFTLVGLLAGCAFTEQIYKGEKLPEEGISRVSGAGGSFTFETVHLRQVDGKNIGPLVGEVEILPGLHNFTVLGTVATGYGAIGYWGYIDIKVEAGHSYQIDMDRYFIWAVDEATGEVVAGLAPP